MTYSFAEANRGPLSAAMGCARAILSFEAPFVLFLFAGIYKADPRLAWFPVDLTLFFAAVSLLAGTFVMLRRRSAVPAVSIHLIVAFAAFAGFAGFSLLWSPSEVYGPQKALLISTIVAWAIGGSALVIAGEPARIRRFTALLQGLSIAVAFEVLWSLGHFTASDAGGGIVEHYLATGRLFAVGAIIVACRSMEATTRGFLRFLDFAVLGGLLALMLALGGRGPFLALTIALSAALATGARRSQEHMFTIRWPAAILGALLGVLLMGVVALLVSGNQELTTIRRLSLLFTEGGGASAGVRLYNYRSAWRAWWDSPVIGHGIGSWPMVAYHVDERNYPHNLILEALAELGLIGVLLLGALFAVPLGRLWRSHLEGRVTSSTVAWLLLLGTFLNALVSGDITDNRFMFAALGLAAGSMVLEPARPPSESGPEPDSMAGSREREMRIV
jgi:O-antigen ligase